MFNPSKKQLVAVYLIAFILALLYIFSLTLFSSDNKKRHSQQLQLLHQADISNIDIITFQRQNQSIILLRRDNMWQLVNPLNADDRLVANADTLQKFFICLANKHTLIKAGKIDSKDEAWSSSSYGFNQQDATMITLYKNGLEYKKLLFGSLNFSQTERYFTTNELNAVYLARQEFEPFLSLTIQNWVDPYIISSQLKDSVFTMGQVQTVNFYDYQEQKACLLDSLNAEDKGRIDKLLELRHGGFVEDQTFSPSESQKCLNLQLQMGDKSKINLDFYKSQTAENEYITEVTFDSQRQGKSFKYKTNISSWTYNKIKEMML